MTPQDWIKRQKELKVRIADLKKKVKEVEEQLNAALRIIGNIVHNSVPVSNNDVYHCNLVFAVIQ